MPRGSASPAGEMLLKALWECCTKAEGAGTTPGCGPWKRGVEAAVRAAAPVRERARGEAGATGRIGAKAVYPRGNAQIPEGKMPQNRNLPPTMVFLKIWQRSSW